MTVRLGAHANAERQALFTWFENLVDPYPEDAPATPPAGFWPFIWAASFGLRRFVAAMVGFTAAIGIFEALLFAMLGSIVEGLSKVAPERLWLDEHARLLGLAAVLVASLGLVAMQSLFRQQSLAGNFAMRLR
jgi:ATP-binding cassette subfamily B multidrug efflux pump